MLSGLHLNTPNDYQMVEKENRHEQNLTILFYFYLLLQTNDIN